MQTQISLKELIIKTHEIEKGTSHIKIMKFEGKITNNNGFELNKKFSEFFIDNKYNIILDLSELQYINSTGIAIIFSMFFKCKENQGKLVVGGLHNFVKRVFSMMTLPEGFRLYNTLDEALQNF
ncbi:MAG: STAS domain-containing protein [Leptospiraceae bacterium]|nr:STAS domain-containing protein [Leptospiraceae bacterium]MDW7974945.1 STAS domain-containing protein [Leptospiraceae bacterium]